MVPLGTTQCETTNIAAVGEPLLLLEAASRYQGDLEDRLTEMFAVALDAHDAFCRILVKEAGVKTDAAVFEVRTQQGFDGQPRLVDLVIRCRDEAGLVLATIFVENKYNPGQLIEPYWFSSDQVKRQADALRRQRGQRLLIGIASSADVRRRTDIPRQYNRILGWDTVADLAFAAGGGPTWHEDARRPNSPASQRILLEFWTYLVGK